MLHDSELPKMQTTLNHKLEKLKTELNDKLSHFQNSFDHQIDVAIITTKLISTEAGTKTKSKIVKITNEAREYPENNIDSIAKKILINSVKPHRTTTESNDRSEAHLKRCNVATAAYWMLIGKAYNEMKCEMIKIGLPVKHPLNYEDIIDRLSDVKTEIWKAINTLPDGSSADMIALWLKTGREKIAELFSKVAIDIKARITLWQVKISDRADNDKARKNEVIPFMLIRMNEWVTTCLENIDYFVQLNFGDTPTTTKLCSYVTNTDSRDDIIACLEKSAGNYGFALEKYGFSDEIIELISFISQELEGIHL